MGGRVVEERESLHPRLSMSSVVPNLVATVLLVGEIVKDAPSPFPTPSTAHVPVATMSPMVGAGDDSPYIPLVVLVGNDSSYLSFEAFTSSSVDVYPQDKGKGFVIDKKEMAVPKRDFEEESLMWFLEGSRRIE
ncbi:hypothetical protein Adt_26952 [Abeliophyllum distichum]|uniref:Uncharacterized protein n=1 Tax=Abeliophyllum distichum TaxID=126358 RepID=A0ABD1RTH6_9LAMI